MISYALNGDFKKTDKFLDRLLHVTFKDKLKKYGEEGVAALQRSTPKRTGLTANSWSYEIVEDDHSVSIEWHNTNLSDGVPVAVLLEYGHATKNGGFVKGIDYINPVIQPIFEKIANEAWKEVCKS